ncbi:AMP-binding protein [Peristeroidobacter soli]|uniref:AMP-binding protein n=1 Tax=Peristeroidobacter soli TaxID=2497877 RepID=UPI00101DAFC4|nr:AMP-binding protein [Peristeroidobacter soli]
MQTTAARPWTIAFPWVARWHEPIKVTTLADLLNAAVARSGEKRAVTYSATTLTYRELAADVDRLATGLRRLGIGRGDAVALYLPNTLFHPISFFAVTKLGAHVVHLSPLDAPREIAHKMKDAGAKALVTTNHANLLTTAQKLLEQGTIEQLLVGDDAHWGGDPAVVPVPRSSRITPLLELFVEPTGEPWPALSPDDLAVLQYTGGTTGLPKGAMLTHANLTAAVSMYHGINPAPDFKAGEERVICVAPLFHIFGLSGIMLSHLAHGNEIVLFPRFDAEAIVREIEINRASIMPGVPTMWIAIANLPDIDKRDLSALKDARSGGAPMPSDVQRRLEQKIGRRILGGWGMTETSPAGTRLVPEEPSRPGLIGIPYPGIDMRIVALDDSSRELGVGEVGEIAVRGPNVFKGYWNRPEVNAEAFAAGYFLTGDIGSIDEKGQFTIVDRKKNMIISSGFNVYPAAIENAIYEHPGVREVIVIGVFDLYRGQAAKAFITLKPGARELPIDELREFLKDRLGRHEMPAAVEYRDSLPRSPAGKLLAKVLIDEESAKLAQASAQVI